MLFGYVVYLIDKNAAIVDLFWTLCVGLISLVYFLVPDETDARSSVVFIFMCIWTVKLSFLLIFRLLGTDGDGRYKKLDALWQSNRRLKYFAFFLLQAFVAFLLTLPIFFSMQTDVSWGWLDVLAFLVASIGLIGGIVSDTQIQMFKRSEGNRGKVCDVGLWGYSRHPNYFFEWVFWVGQFLFALSTNLGWVSIISPLALLATLLFFSGIPPAEKQALESKGEAYREYQKRVSAFIPWKKG